MTERLHFHFSLSCIGEGNGNPLQCSCLEKPRDRGAWWAAVYGVAQSRTRLKQLSSSRRSCFAIELGDTVVKNLPANAGGARNADSIPGSATLSSILAWKILWTEELGGLQSMGSQRAGHN